MIFKDLYDRHFKFDFTWLVCVFCFGFLKTTIFSLIVIFNFGVYFILMDHLMKYLYKTNE